MRLLFITIALALAALPCCTDGDHTKTGSAGVLDGAAAMEEPSPGLTRPAGRWPETIELPVVPIVGELPSAEERIDIGVDATGAITVNGQPTDLAGLFDRLERFADLPPGEVYSDAFAVIALDASLPWIVGMRCQQRCSWAGVRRTFFAVRGPDGRCGALAVFVPRDHAGRFPHNISFLHVLVDETGTPTRPSEIAAELRSAISEDQDVGIVIDGAPSAPVSLVLALVGTAAEEGVRAGGLVMPWGGFPKGEPADDVQRFAAESASNHASIRGWDMLGVAREWPPPAELAERYVGFFAMGHTGSTHWFPDRSNDD